MRYVIAILFLFLTTNTTAHATTMYFTDRASFEAAVGATQTVTIDQPIAGTVANPAVDPLFYSATIDGLLTYSGDINAFQLSATGLIVPETSTGGICLCSLIPGQLSTIGPVLAFGGDFTSHSVPMTLGGPSLAIVDFAGAQFIVGQTSFLGVLYSFDDAAVVSPQRVYQASLTATPLGGSELSSYSISNIEVKTVPEPSSVWLLALSLFSIGMLTCKRRWAN